MPNRVNLDETVSPKRRPIDAGWNKRRKIVVGAVSGCLAVAAAAGGLMVWSAMTPPPLPRSAEEAMRVLASDRFDRLEPERREAYVTEASRLLQDLPADQRRAFFQELPEEHRQGMRVLMEERMDDLARRIARGEVDPSDPETMREMFGGMRRGEGGGRPGGGDGGGDRGGWRGGDGNWQARISDRLSQQVQSGSAQRTGLRTEMFRAMREARGGAGPGGGPGRGGGGGRPGGGGGGG